VRTAIRHRQDATTSVTHQSQCMVEHARPGRHSQSTEMTGFLAAAALPLSTTVATRPPTGVTDSGAIQRILTEAYFRKHATCLIVVSNCAISHESL